MRYRPPSRVRASCKWVITALGALLLIAWAVSLGRQLTICLPDDYFAIGSGCVGYPEGQWSDPEEVTLKLNQIVWLPIRFPMPPVSFFPLWIPLLTVVFPTIVLWYIDRRPPTGHCHRCGYNLTGNESGVCPECGATAPDYVAAHKHCIRHRKELLASGSCGCFKCLRTFAVSEIEEWTDDSEGVGQTAICPFCGIDSVIGSASGFPINKAFLARMERYWFGSR